MTTVNNYILTHWKDYWRFAKKLAKDYPPDLDESSLKSRLIKDLHENHFKHFNEDLDEGIHTNTLRPFSYKYFNKVIQEINYKELRSILGI